MNVQNFSFTLRPIIYIETLLGVVRFKFNGYQTKHPSFLYKIYGLLVISLSIVNNIITYRTPTMGKVVSLYVTMRYVCYATVALQYGLFVIVSWIQTESNLSLVEKVEKIDKKLNIDKTSTFYKKSFRKIVSYMIALFSFHILYSIGMIRYVCDTNVENWEVISYFPSYFIHDLELTVFATIVDIMTIRLRLMNLHLERFGSCATEARSEAIANRNISHFHKLKSFFQLFFFTDKELRDLSGNVNMTLLELAQLYERISNTCKLINRLFDIQLLSILITTFSGALLSTCSMLLLAEKTIEDSEAGEFVFSTIWCIHYFVFIVIICLICERHQSEVKKTEMHLSKIMLNGNLATDQMRELQRFSSVASYRSEAAGGMRFTACRMFSLDLSLLLNFLNVSTSYFIVLIQLVHFNKFYESLRCVSDASTQRNVTELQN